MVAFAAATAAADINQVTHWFDSFVQREPFHCDYIFTTFFFLRVNKIVPPG
jgi:hypothetical protein